MSALFVSLFYVGVGSGVFYGGLSHVHVVLRLNIIWVVPRILCSCWIYKS